MKFITMLHARCFHTSIILAHRKGTDCASPLRPGRFLNKLMDADMRKKDRPKYRGPDILYPEFNKNSMSTHNTRRANVLSNIFMKHITDLLATGDVAPDLINQGIEISHVVMAPDFKCVNVYWSSNIQTVDTEALEKKLHSASGHLQNKLTALKVIGIVPPINFVKNWRLLAVREVENRLKKVDFGEDYVPTCGRDVMKKNDTVLHTSLSKDIKDQILENEKDETKDGNSQMESDEVEIKFPAMRHDTMSLNHHRIMNKVKVSMQRMKSEEREEVLKMQSIHRNAEDVVDIYALIDSKEENELFDEFIKQRKIEYRKRKNRELRIDLRGYGDESDVSYELFNENTSDRESYHEEQIDEFRDFETFKF